MGTLPPLSDEDSKFLPKRPISSRSNPCLCLNIRDPSRCWERHKEAPMEYST